MAGSGPLALRRHRRHHLELHWARRRLGGVVFVMVVDAVVYDNRLWRRSPGGWSPIETATDADVEAFVDEVLWTGRGSLLITWLGPPTTVVETDIDIVPVVVTAAVTHRELDSDKRNFLWVLIEMKQADSKSRTIQSLLIISFAEILDC